MSQLLLLGTALVAFADAGLAADLGPYRPGSIKDEPAHLRAGIHLDRVLRRRPGRPRLGRPDF